MKVALTSVVGLVLLVLLVPTLRQGCTGLLRNSETITVTRDSVDGGLIQEQELELVTLLGFDAIPAILDPEFVTAAEADSRMDPTEQVLGLSVNGEHRAYSVRMLSRHEIVNDVVGGVPLAVTW